MRRHRRALLAELGLALIASACISGGRAEQGEQGGQPEQVPLLIVDRGALLLDCREQAGAGIHVLFECDSATVYACRSMARAVLEYEDGARESFAQLRDAIGTFASRGAHDGKRIVAVWVDTHAGTGVEPQRGEPIGQRVEAPQDSCRGFAIAAQAETTPG